MRIRILTILAMLLHTVLIAQPTPVALPSTSPYTQDFNTTPGALGTSYPSGWGGYNFGTTYVSSMSTGTSTSTTGAVYNYGSNIGILGSGTNYEPGALILVISNTTGKTGLAISWDVIKIREQTRDSPFGLQISTTSPTSGYTTISGGAYQSGTIAQGTTTSFSNINISAYDNYSGPIYIRWYYGTSTGSGSRDGLALDNVSISWSPTGCSTVTPGTISSSTGTTFCTSATPTLTLTGASSGTGISYQWQSSTDSLSWSPISGATSTSYGPISISTTTYYRAVTTCSTSGAKDSASIGIHVTALPTASVSGTATICSGASSTISFSGTPNAVVTYTVNGGSNQTITLNSSGSATVSTGTLTANAIYALVSASLNGCSQTQTGSVTVTVNALPTVTISGTATICSGGNSNITFTGTPNATVTYTINGGSNQTVTLNGSGSATVNTGAITASATYALVSVIAGTCSQTQTGSLTVTVNALPTVTISGTTSICSGSNSNITFTGTPNATVTYTINGGGNLTVTLNGSGTATVNTGAITAVATYALVSVSAGICSQAQTGTAVVSIYALPTATISGTTSICSGGSTTITFTGTPNATVTYNINGGSNLTVTLNGSGTATVNTGALTVLTTYNLVSVNDGTCSTAITGNATVTINPLPVATISGTATICEGGNTNITFSGDPNAVVTYNVNGGSNVTVTLDGTGNAVVNTGVLTSTTTYNLVSVYNGTCTGSLSASVVVTVNLLPTATILGTATICAGDNTNITFTGTPNAVVSYNIDGGSMLTVTLDGAGSATVNSGALITSATYNITGAVVNSCPQTLIGSAIITVTPLPTVSISGSGAVCSGQGTNIIFTGTPNAIVTYTLNTVTQTITLDASGNASVSTGNLTSTASYDIVSVSAGSCGQNLTGNATITVSPLPTASISGTATICSGTNTNITFTGTPNATVTYTINMGAPLTIMLDAAGSAVLGTGNLAAMTTYELISVSSGLCSDNLNGNAVISINPIPTATISGSGNVCIGNASNIMFTGTPFATVYYTINGGAPQSIVLDAAGNASVGTGILSSAVTYALTGASLNSCVGTLAGNATVTVSPAPTASISGTTTLTPGNITDITFTGTPNATVNYTVNGGPLQSIVLNASGTATLNSGVLYYDATYTLVSVTSGCTEIISGSVVVTMTIAFGPIYTYTNATTGAYNFVASNATATNLTLANGTVVSSTPCASGYTTEGYGVSSTYDPLTNKAVRIKVTPDILHRLIITGFGIGVRRSVDGPQHIRLAYSLDNGNNWISSGLDQAPNNSTCDDITTYNWATLPFQVVSTTDGILLAVFGFDAAAMTGQFQILNLIVNGAVIETPLPVTLTSFTGDCNSNTMSFKWQVEKENNIKGYDLEYSETGKTFLKVASQAVTVVNTNANTYKAILYDASEGLYRLALNDMSGTRQYSNVLRVKCGEVVAATPTTVNVTGNTLAVNMGSEFNSNDRISIKVFGMNGQLVSNNSDLSFSPVMKQELALAQGIYLVRVVQGGVVSTHKIVVE